MGSGNWYPVVSGDDGYCRSSTFSNAGTFIAFGKDQNHNNCRLFVRYPGVTIPKNSIITSAYVRYRSAYDRPSAEILTNIYFNAVDNAVAPTTTAQYDGLALTSVIPWDFATGWDLNSYYNTLDISSILQEIIDRDGWTPGNAIMFLHKNDGSADYRYRRAHSQDSGTYSPHLFAEWSLPAGGEITRRNLLFRPRQGDSYGSRR